LLLLQFIATFYAIITSNSGESPSSLSYLSSAPAGCSVPSCPPPPQRLVTPRLPSGGASTSRRSAASRRAPLHRWCSRLSSALAVFYVTFCHADAFCPLALPPLVVPSPLPLILPSRVSCPLWLVAGCCVAYPQQCPIALKVHTMQHLLVRAFARDKATSRNMQHDVLCSSGCDRCEEQAKIG
jgi:hypothetical protein